MQRTEGRIGLFDLRQACLQGRAAEVEHRRGVVQQAQQAAGGFDIAKLQVVVIPVVAADHRIVKYRLIHGQTITRIKFHRAIRLFYFGRAEEESRLGIGPPGSKVVR
ncbi:hypothetical protein D3C80_1758010 [compost metagenome]